MIYIGIEAGGTTTRLMVQRDMSDPAFHSVSRSFKVQNGDFAASALTLRDIMREIISEGFTNSTSIAIGLAGMSREKDQQSLREAIHALPELAHVALHIETDATLTLSAVLAPGAAGILLIIGTGSVIFFQPQGGTPRRIGGWGPTLSDEGSGYRIGLRALRHYIHVLDCVARPDTICTAVAARLPEDCREDRIALSTLVQRDPSFVASLARDILEAASLPGAENDILMEELIELVLLIEPILGEPVMGFPGPYTVFLSGSIAHHPLMRKGLAMALMANNVQFRLVEDHIPALRALEIARSIR